MAKQTPEDKLNLEMTKIVDHHEISEWRHFYTTEGVTWQGTLNLAKQETKFAAPGTLVIAHNHNLRNWSECNKLCKIVSTHE